jgi:hypothetical protein
LKTFWSKTNQVSWWEIANNIFKGHITVLYGLKSTKLLKLQKFQISRSLRWIDIVIWANHGLVDLKIQCLIISIKTPYMYDVISRSIKMSYKILKYGYTDKINTNMYQNIGDIKHRFPKFLKSLIVCLKLWLYKRQLVNYLKWKLCVIFISTF